MTKHEGMGRRKHHKVGPGGAKCDCCLYDTKKNSRRSERHRSKQETTRHLQRRAS